MVAGEFWVVAEELDTPEMAGVTCEGAGEEGGKSERSRSDCFPITAAMSSFANADCHQSIITNTVAVKIF